jgi:hypothetical protein
MDIEQQANIAALDTVTTNEANIATNTANIAALDTRVTTNEANIAKHSEHCSVRYSLRKKRS